MKKLNILLTIYLLILLGCGKGKQVNTPSDSFITVDVTTDYPKKELILQDFMDVEYIPLETTDEFITQGIVRSVDKDILLVTNSGVNGDIFVFNRSGKALRKINRKGQSGEEYSQITELVLDSDQNEMFVVDYPARKILVYDLSGIFKRSLKFEDTGYYSDVFNYDRDHLICYKSYVEAKENEQACHLIVSKQDGSIIKEIRIPFEGIKTPVATRGEFTITPEFHLVFPNRADWILVNTSSDTLYNYLPDGRLTPFIVRTPSVQTMELEEFLFPGTFTDRYCFMRTLKKEFNFERMKGFPSTDLMYDMQEKTLFEYTLYNDDYTTKREISLGSQPINHSIAACQSLEASMLIEANEKGELKGKLKEIAATLDEESNPVILLVRYKK